jgi:hypothetical protein
MKNYQITISKFSGVGEVKREDWKDLISSLVMVGYEVYADEDKLIFKLGDDDKVEEIKE